MGVGIGGGGSGGGGGRKRSWRDSVVGVVSILSAVS